MKTKKVYIVILSFLLGVHILSAVNTERLGIFSSVNNANEKRIFTKVFVVKPASETINSDVGVESIIRPPVSLESTAVISPRVRIKNYGPNNATCTVYCRIGEWVSQKLVENLPPLNSRNVTFDSPPWTVSQRGIHLVRCSTALVGDENPQNDTLSKLFKVIVYDVGCGAIISPGEVIDSTYELTPKVWIKNFGTEVATNFQAHFMILDGDVEIYHDDTTITVLSSAESLQVNFSAWEVRRGNFTAKCSTYFSRDSNPFNNQLVQDFRVRVHDVGVKNIVLPVGILDSTGPIRPRAWIKNYGTEEETFEVNFQISRGSLIWKDDTTITLNSLDSALILFDEWQPRRGRYFVKCATSLPNDIVADNNTRGDSFEIKVYDYAVRRITAPPSVIDSSSSLTPKAWIINWGTEAEENVPVVFQIEGTSYLDTQYVSLGSIDSTEQEFRVLTVDFPRGNYLMRCWSLLARDLNEENNEAQGELLVSVCDVGIMELLVPGVEVESTATIIPQVKVKNFGTSEVSFEVSLGIGEYYCRKEVPALKPESSYLVEFDPWEVLPRGNYLVQCSTLLVGDLVSANDTLSRVFSVTVPDFGLKRLDPPDTTIYAGNYLIPQARVYNFGSTYEADVPVVCYIPNTGYYSLKAVTLAPQESTEVVFDSLLVDFEDGNYRLICKTMLARDIISSSDSLYSNLEIIVPGWVLKESLPYGAEANRGSAMAVLAGKIYLLQGGNSNLFWMYDPETDIWRSRYAIPYLISASGEPIKKKVKDGGALAAAGGRVYAFKGNNTTEFWVYFPERDSWAPRTPIPEAYPGFYYRKRVKSGGALVAIRDSIYALKGGNCEEFWVYDIVKDSWYPKKPLMGPLNKKPKGGASLCAVGDTIYALLGGNTYYFYQYLPAHDSWIRKVDAGFGYGTAVKRKLKDGASLSSIRGQIYAIKGGGTRDFGSYLIVQDTWITLETVPGPVRIKAGGSLVSYQDKVYLIKGGGSQELWRYVPIIDKTYNLKPAPETPAPSDGNFNNSQGVSRFFVTPSLIKDFACISYTLKEASLVKIKLYNSAGQLQKHLVNERLSAGTHQIIFNRKGLTSGVYYLMLDLTHTKRTSKIIVK
jgi:hypothetical protein